MILYREIGYFVDKREGKIKYERKLVFLSNFIFMIDLENDEIKQSKSLRAKI